MHKKKKMSLLNNDDGVPYIQLGKYQIKLEKEELTEELKAKAKKELRESEDIVEQGFKELRALISGKKIHLTFKIRFTNLMFSLWNVRWS